MANISIRDVRKTYGKDEVVHGVNLEIANGEFIVILGPSGCGKSTLLRMIAGLESVTAGQIAIAGTVVNDLEPRERGCAMVFQNYALYPHMTVAENIGYALKVSGMAKAARLEKVQAVAASVGLSDYLDRRPGQLSGGQRQRVAMARAIIREPRVFLFDEPLSNLDAKLRVQMRVELEALHRDLKATMIYVTHDQVEAMTMADKIVVLNAGRIEQVGSPMDLYHRPLSEFVAGFIGAPAMNFLTMADAGGRVSVEGHVLTAATLPGAIKLGIRPEHLALLPAGQGDLAATVTLRETLGGDAYLYVRTGGGQALVVRAEGDTTLDHGAGVGLGLAAHRLHQFGADGRTLTPGGRP